jgi:hypothetical protein
VLLAALLVSTPKSYANDAKLKTFPILKALVPMKLPIINSADNFYDNYVALARLYVMTRY